jgi:hypothetical protein
VVGDRVLLAQKKKKERKGENEIEFDREFEK